MFSDSYISTFNAAHNKPCRKCESNFPHTVLEAGHLNLSELSIIVYDNDAKLSLRYEALLTHNDQFADEKEALEKLKKSNGEETANLVRYLERGLQPQYLKLEKLQPHIKDQKSDVEALEARMSRAKWRGGKSVMDTIEELEEAQRNLNDLVAKKCLLESDLEKFWATVEEARKGCENALKERERNFARKSAPPAHLGQVEMATLTDLYKKLESLPLRRRAGSGLISLFAIEKDGDRQELCLFELDSGQFARAYFILYNMT
ncbi:hypothetical protein BDZ45DRAFT_808098 [Acephala macrosclerotiorum]|nr:hypothetical protein BDZ45DRAFT_808098 [Acephala macrosclerotiorum]